MELINKTIGQCLREQAARNGDHPALETGRWSCTFRQLDRISDALVKQMEALGIIRGTHVGIWSVNSPDWVFTFLA
ncbi:MAG: AMP-binding protein, partial [Enterocloster sp.]